VAVTRKDATMRLVAALILVGLMLAFAVELARTQARDRADVRTRVHQRSELAAALIDALFATAARDTSTEQRDYGGAVVGGAALERNLGANVYLALFGASGALIAHTPGFDARAAAALRRDPRFAAVRAGAAYGLGNVVPWPGGGVIDFTLAFQTGHGRRILVTGFRPSALSAFLAGDMQKIPGVAGEVNYVVDGNGVVLAAGGAAVSAGARFRGPRPAQGQPAFTADRGGHYYDEAPLAASDWRIVLDSPDGPLFASVSGLNKWVPWLIFGAFAVVALLAFALLGRVLSAVAETRVANSRLALVNRELESTNVTLELRATELARSNEDLDQFASVASHDLQEPLRRTRTFVQELTRIEASRLSDRGVDYLERAAAGIERMQTLIEDLLRYSRVATAAGQFAPVELDATVAEALDDLSELIDRTGTVVHVGALPTIRAEPVQMRQLVQNLVSNAIKFQPRGRTPEVWIESLDREGEVELTVRDNGIGFDPRDADRIFRVFERLHGRGEYSGTGIGLALCRKIAERHGGSIRAESVPGTGSSFVVTLPLREPVSRLVIGEQPIEQPAGGAARTQAEL
jgi:signal transduction histidine kinase